VTVLVDTSVWSLALRRDAPTATAEVTHLGALLAGSDQVVTTGIVLQELLQGFTGPKARQQLIERFSAIPLLSPDRDDHIEAAEVRNLCRRRGVQLVTIDALIAQLCIRHELVLLTADNDFRHAAQYIPLIVWPDIVG
jgi:predicted nucleic acid-binding protein